MPSPSRSVRALAALGVGAVALAACGGSDDASSSPSSSSTGSSSAPAAAQSVADGVLTVGTLLPQTGSLASLGPSEFAGVKLAIKDINDAGGVLGKPAVEVDSDSGDTSTNIASSSVDRLLSQKADAIVGAASSAVSLTVIDKITGAGVVQISPANTSLKLSDYPDKGLYFRTAPPDLLQGRVLGDKVIADGIGNVGILALQDAYGTGLADTAQKAIEGANGQVVEKVIYDPKAAEFSAEVSKIKAKAPDGIILIGFNESAKIIQELVKQGIGPQTTPLYMVDGNLEAAEVQALGPVIQGVQGTTPGAQAPNDFRQRLLTVDPALRAYPYAGEAYDATILVALAAEAAKKDDGRSIGAAMVASSKGGQKCTSFKECAPLARAGTDFDYDGISGPIELDDKGNPTEASIGIYTYGPDAKLLADVVYKSGKI